ncbi:MAG: hypothetical protein L6R40_003605 [Gallowayella cf. fulva]|nr:MAG: hypothetical protein L6R40_003605 [Xanthomendoza cf. fulva]
MTTQYPIRSVPPWVYRKCEVSGDDLRPAQGESQWLAFVKANRIPIPAGQEGTIVTTAELNQGVDYYSPWRGRSDPPTPRKPWHKRLKRKLMVSPFPPLALRGIVFIASIVALVMAALIYRHDEDGKNPSAKMAIAVDAIALVYLVVSSWDEFTAPPIGLRTATVKTLLVLLDLGFIVFSSANLSIAYSTASTESDDRPTGRLLIWQYTLASVLLVALIAWLLTFTISVLRQVVPHVLEAKIY